MKTTNQELHELGLPQIIIEDATKYVIKPNATVEEMNKQILESMYKVQDSIYKLFSQCDMREIEANTISPSQQNIFMPLKSWNINLNGCFAIVSIKQRFWNGCFAEIEIL